MLRKENYQMNKLLKKVLAVVITASMMLTALPVLASGGASLQGGTVISSVENTDISAKAVLKRNGKRIFTVCLMMKASHTRKPSFFRRTDCRSARFWRLVNILRY